MENKQKNNKFVYAINYRVRQKIYYNYNFIIFYTIMIFNSVFDFCIFVYTIALMRRILLQLYVQMRNYI